MQNVSEGRGVRSLVLANEGVYDYKLTLSIIYTFIGLIQSSEEKILEWKQDFIEDIKLINTPLMMKGPSELPKYIENIRSKGIEISLYNY